MAAPFGEDFLQIITGVHWPSFWLELNVASSTPHGGANTDLIDVSFPDTEGGTPGYHYFNIGGVMNTRFIVIPVNSPTTDVGHIITPDDLSQQFATESGQGRTGFGVGGRTASFKAADILLELSSMRLVQPFTVEFTIAGPGGDTPAGNPTSWVSLYKKLPAGIKASIFSAVGLEVPPSFNNLLQPVSTANIGSLIPPFGPIVQTYRVDPIAHTVTLIGDNVS